jgi:peroxiredoxin
MPEGVSEGGWDAIPGARGCTPEACGFRDHQRELRELGVAVVGVSSQGLAEQRAAVDRHGLGYPLASDPQMELSRELGLPTFETGGRTYYHRLTMVVSDGAIEHVFYPVFPPDRHAAEVVDWLSTRGMGDA